jgi:hypothetical protein
MHAQKADSRPTPTNYEREGAQQTPNSSVHVVISTVKFVLQVPMDARMNRLSDSCHQQDFPKVKSITFQADKRADLLTGRQAD